MMNPTRFSSLFWTLNLLLLPVLSLPAQASNPIACGDEILQVLGIWEKGSDHSLEIAAQKSIKHEDHDFKLPVKDGVISVWDGSFQNDKFRRVMVSKTNNNPKGRNIDIRFDSKNGCSISSISFYEPEVTISGEDCYWISVESKKTEDDGTEFSHPDKDNEHMLGYIFGIYLKTHKSLPAGVEHVFQKVRNNCRNRAILSKLSKGPLGFSHDSEIKIERRFWQEEINAENANH